MNRHSRDIAVPGPTDPLVPARQAYRLDIARTREEVLALEADWRALEAAAEGAVLFQGFDFSRDAVEHFAAYGDGDFFVCTVRAAETLVAILPLRLQRKKLRTVLTGLGEPFQQYTEMLLAPGHDAAAAFGPIEAELNKSGADYLHFGQVRRDGALFAAIDGRIPATGEEKGAPSVPLADWPDFDTYFKTIKSKTRKNMRNARNRLERDGTLAHDVAFDGAVLDGVIARTFAGRAEWLERMGLTSRAFQNTGFEAFLDRFKTGGASGVTRVAMSFRLDDTPIAEQWGFVHNGRYYAFISTWNAAYEESSPGKLHLGAVLEACYAEGLATADFMVPAVPYKLTWASHVVPVDDHVLPISLRGRLYGGVWLKVLRPLAKKIAYAVPRDLRRAIVEKFFAGRAG